MVGEGWGLYMPETDSGETEKDVQQKSRVSSVKMYSQAQEYVDEGSDNPRYN